MKTLLAGITTPCCCSLTQTCLNLWLCGLLHHTRLPPSFTVAQSLLKLMSIESTLPFILCRPLLLLPSIFHSVRVFSSELSLRIRWPQYWSFSISVTCEKPEGWPFWNPHSVVSEQPHAVNHVEALGDEATSWLSPENVSGQDHLHSVMIWDLSVLDSSSPAVLTQWEKD